MILKSVAAKREGEATTPTEQRSQEFCADDNVSNYSLFVFEHDNL
jgi:hypothetical protein